MYRVALYAHNLEQTDPTGIGYYYQRLIEAVMDSTSMAEMGISCLVAGSPRSLGSGPAMLYKGPVVRPRFPRKPLHLAWGLMGHPLVDRALGYPDLIHILNPFTPVPSRAPVVYTVHDLWPVLRPEWYSRKERFVCGRALEDAAQRSRLVIANSSSTAAQLSERMGVEPERIRVIPMAVDDVYFKPVPPSSVERACREYGLELHRYVVYVGAVSTRKNLLPVLEALAQGGTSCRCMMLVVIGPPGPGYEQTIAQARRLGLGRRVRFTGWLPQEALVPLLDGAAALVHPAADEGFGMTPLEAMARGVPTVISSAGALPEVAGGASLVIDPHDSRGWAEAMCRLLEDQALAASLSEKGRARAASFRWPVVASSTIGIYREVLGL